MSSTVTRVRVPTYVDYNGVTLYPIEVMTEDGKIHKVAKRYSDVLAFHQTVLKAAPHSSLDGFNFPHKSMFNTSAEFTKERRRSGFEEYFELLLRLGSEYAPFLATFLKDTKNQDDFDELGEREPSDDSPAAQHTEIEEVRLARRRPRTSRPQQAFALARPATAFQWLAEFYLPVTVLTWTYTQLLTLLGCLRPTDWSSGAVWLAIATSPLVLTIFFAFAAPFCGSALDTPQR